LILHRFDLAALLLANGMLPHMSRPIPSANPRSTNNLGRFFKRYQKDLEES
jgi:hypothetical protein